jgi:hypothetical protein
MKKLLIIVLMLWGCDGIPCALTFSCEDEGTCVLKYTETNLYKCYPDTTESQCIGDSDNNDSIIIRYWGENYDCNEFCNSQIPDEICEIH